MVLVENWLGVGLCFYVVLVSGMRLLQLIWFELTSICSLDLHSSFLSMPFLYLILMCRLDVFIM